MASIAPGLDGFIAAQQLGQQRQAQEIGILSRLAQLQMQQQAAARQAKLDPLQIENLQSQIAERNAKIADAQTQRQALGILSRLQSPEGSYQGPTAPGVPTGVATNEQDALRAVMEAEAQGRPMAVNVPNPANVRSLTALAFPEAYGKAQAGALFPKPEKPITPRQSIVPVTGGYLQPNANGQMEFVRTQESGVGRPEPAPSVKDIIDPKNPSRLISVDVRKYKGGSVGDEGVIGVAGREPTAQKKSEQVDIGRDLVNSVVITLKDYYDRLNAGGGVVNQERGALPNIGARIGASAIGQTIGGAVGTKNQNIRDSIEQQRPMLLRAIMQATGMSARQLDSNAELKLWLATATDPTKGYQANMDALNNLAELFGKGGFKNKSASQKIGGANQGQSAPEGIDPALWNVMTPQERALWQK